MWTKTKFLADSTGFTLLEVLIALAIMAVTFSAILMIQSSSLDAQERTRRMTEVAILAKTTLSDTEIHLEGKEFREVKEEETGEFETPFEAYTWKREIKEVEFPDLTAGIAGGGEQSEQEQSTTSDQFGKLITKYLSDAIREVTVTISWDKGSGEQSYSISTYWVNLNSEFSLTQ